MDPSQIYSSLRLSAHQFRLVHLLPGQESSEIQCTLKSDYLLSHTVERYTALSYEWGDSKASKLEIKLEGQSFLITQNLWSALKCLRGTETMQTFWIDAICINQDDKNERNHQVELMSLIYSTASRVLVWLGQECAEIQAAFSFFQNIWDTKLRNFAEKGILYIDHNTNMYQSIILTQGQAQYFRFRWSDESLVEENSEIQTALYWSRFQIILENLAFFGQKDPSLKIAWKGLASLTSRSYWTRIWIVQEYLLAQKVDFYCGRITIDGTIIDTIISHLAALKDEKLTDLPSWLTEPLQRIRASPATRICTSRLQQKSKRPTLLELLVACKDSKSSEPRDRLYALLGLASDVQEDSIVIDYNRPIFKIQMDVLWFFCCKQDFRPADTSRICTLLEETLGYGRDNFEMDRSYISSKRTTDTITLPNFGAAKISQTYRFVECLEPSISYYAKKLSSFETIMAMASWTTAEDSESTELALKIYDENSVNQR
ncbi:hypothetical protein GLAREA_03179 [Glarea lozoyensis ATCC 20868]|uniref:Heterokaryon incompatibility domain-containing protein n=1 Tax=Glarea lozoyensis (strain ATCC 20868 / MF5171) TaxID=1116229 RepID=S3CQ62_GLAL2|nr:uncharacterized protein GLAREA_03179 [Glarea lozoyensis ATCC 20868]EPE27264.1 hypothetical protein GLAREA_03179 [Glarea lozoyensis ATCC 20868]